jgi:hypothetical protein
MEMRVGQWVLNNISRRPSVMSTRGWRRQRGLKLLKTRAPSVLPTGYRPELDTTRPCNEEDTTYYMGHIGVLRWAVELGRIDICAEVSMMAAYMAAPREGHMEAVMRIFAYLNGHERSRVMLDPRYVDHAEVEKPSWSDFYSEAREMLPPDMPEPLGRPIQMTTFVDSDHAGDKVTRRSRTGVLIFFSTVLLCCGFLRNRIRSRRPLLGPSSQR